MKKPVLLVTFNRPELTRTVLRAIREYEPEVLFVFQDGAREGNTQDIERCQQVRTVISESIDWKCDVHTLYSEVNLGCGPGPARGISWFFEHVDEGIIIEDDAVPHIDFFEFAAQMLDRYRNDGNVMCIGSMQLEGKRYGDGSYYFSRMNHTLCAWATWRRAWGIFDIKLVDLNRKELNSVLRRYKCDLREREYWCARLDEIHKDGLHNSSWDQQFWMSIWRRGGKGILPNVNLCSNIGFCEDSTHTWNSNSPAAAKKTSSILPIIHPTDESIQRLADRDFQRIYFDPDNYGKKGRRRLKYRLNRRLKRLLGHEGSWIKK